MIIVNGNQFRTLQEPLYVNGTQVLKVLVNNKKVYPEGSDTKITKIRGFIELDLNHNEYGEGMRVYDAGGDEFFYPPGDHSYKVRAAFSFVIKSDRANYSDSGMTLSACTMGSAPVNLIFPYTASSNPFLPAGDGVHPLLGCPSIETKTLSWYTDYPYSLEMLVYLDMIPPPVCKWTAEEFAYGLGYPWINVTATPVNSRLQEAADDVNGLTSLNRVENRSSGWYTTGPSGQRNHYKISGTRSSYYGYIGFNYLTLETDAGYLAQYRLNGTRRGVESEGYVTLNQKFNFVNIPVTDCVYSKPEWLVPEKERHPIVEDLQWFIDLKNSGNDEEASS